MTLSIDEKGGKGVIDALKRWSLQRISKVICQIFSGCNMKRNDKLYSLGVA